MRKTISMATAAAVALGMAGSALAAPYYLKIEGVEGESTASATDDRHKDWIIIDSLSVAKGQTRRRGGVPVSAGDKAKQTGFVKAKPARARSATSGGGGAGKVSMGSAASAKPAGRGLVVDTPDPIPAGLLLPAVQKVRSAKLQRPAWPGCKAGNHLGPVQIRNEAGDRTGRILDATVEHCASEQVSLNFSKIEW